MSHSVAGSVKSKNSYKSVRPKSYVDETLFGNHKSGEGQSQMAKAGATILSINELRRIRENAVKGLQSDAVVLPQSEIDRIRKTSVIMTKEQKEEEAKLMESQKEAQKSLHNARIKRMHQMDKERNNKLPPNEFEIEDKQKKIGVLSMAQKILDEEKDDVKTMNQMVLYSKCVTIRDKQLEEQKRLEDEYREENRRLDIMMEIERLKNIKHKEEIEQKRKDAQRQGALVIVEQIKERELERLKQQELQEREKLQMQEHIKKLKVEEEIQLKKERELAK